MLAVIRRGLLPLPSVHLAAEFRSLAFYISLSSVDWNFPCAFIKSFGTPTFFIFQCHAPGVWRYTDFQLTSSFGGFAA